MTELVYLHKNVTTEESQDLKWDLLSKLFYKIHNISFRKLWVCNSVGVCWMKQFKRSQEDFALLLFYSIMFRKIFFSIFLSFIWKGSAADMKICLGHLDLLLPNLRNYKFKVYLECHFYDKSQKESLVTSSRYLKMGVVVHAYNLSY